MQRYVPYQPIAVVQGSVALPGSQLRSSELQPAPASWSRAQPGAAQSSSPSLRGGLASPHLERHAPPAPLTASLPLPEQVSPIELSLLPQLPWLLQPLSLQSRQHRPRPAAPPAATSLTMHVREALHLRESRRRISQAHLATRRSASCRSQSPFQRPQEAFATLGSCTRD